MKLCQICGATAALSALSCVMCGEGSFMVIADAPAPVDEQKADVETADSQDSAVETESESADEPVDDEKPIVIETPAASSEPPPAPEMTQDEPMMVVPELALETVVHEHRGRRNR